MITVTVHSMLIIFIYIDNGMALAIRILYLPGESLAESSL